MNPLNILVTGGAGFIGSHIVDELLARGHRVRVLDSLWEQVHGDLGGQPPAYLNPEAEFIYGDVRDSETLARALDGIDAVYHEAAAVGVGQSMYAIREYCDVNTMGTATLLELIVGRFRDQIRKVIVASSMSIYGEGAYRDPATGQRIIPVPRTTADLEAARWDLAVAGTDRTAEPIPTPEDKPVEPTSIYAINKRDQEEMVLVTCRAYGIPAVALRYFNVYGPRQALSNPYTGVGAIFCSRYLNGNAPIVFEDGAQSRDFVHVTDIARANALALERPEADGHAINIGTGRATSILSIAQMLLAHLHPDRQNDPALQPKVLGKFRAGDIRHCFADIARARRLLGYEPRVQFEDGIEELVGWVRTQTAIDRSDDALRELKGRGLA